MKREPGGERSWGKDSLERDFEERERERELNKERSLERAFSREIFRERERAFLSV